MDKLIAVGACVQLVMASVGWVGQRWRWWVLGMPDKARVVGRMSGDAGALTECEAIH